MSEPLSVLIVGGGIGGLTAALALSRSGFRVSLFERAKDFKPIGAGLQLSANALSVLEKIGLTMRGQNGIDIASTEVRDGNSGKMLSRIATPDNNNTLVISRPDLQTTLLQAVTADANIELNTGSEVVDMLGGKSVASLTLSNGTMHTGDALIGADGVWSQTRRMVNSARPDYSGRIAWRATMPLSNVPKDISRHTVTLWLAKGAHLVTYPIANGASFNAVGIIQDNWQAEGWTEKGNMAELALAFSDWHSPVQRLLQSTDSWQKWALCTVDPTMNWTKGRMALLGDAAHAMVPFMAQGAGMSIEDAWVLARHLGNASRDTVPEALMAYQAERQDRVTKVWETSMQQGKIYHLSGPMRLSRNLVMQAGGNLLKNRYNWIYDWRPQ